MEEEQFIDFTKPRQRENGRIKYRREELVEIGRKPGLTALPAGINMSVIRELEELTFFDSGPKPDWSKDKGYGRLDFLRPGGGFGGPIRSRLVADGSLPEELPPARSVELHAPPRPSESLDIRRSSSWRPPAEVSGHTPPGERWNGPTTPGRRPGEEYPARRGRWDETKTGTTPERETWRSNSLTSPNSGEERTWRGAGPTGAPRPPGPPGRWGEEDRPRGTGWGPRSSSDERELPRRPPPGMGHDEKWTRGGPPGSWEQEREREWSTRREGAAYGGGGNWDRDPSWMHDGQQPGEAAATRMPPPPARNSAMTAKDIERERQEMQAQWRAQASGKAKDEDDLAFLRSESDDEEPSGIRPPPAAAQQEHAGSHPSRSRFFDVPSADITGNSQQQQPSTPAGDPSVVGRKLTFDQFKAAAAGGANSTNPAASEQPLQHQGSGASTHARPVTMAEVERQLSGGPLQQLLQPPPPPPNVPSMPAPPPPNVAAAADKRVDTEASKKLMAFLKKPAGSSAAAGMNSTAAPGAPQGMKPPPGMGFASPSATHTADKPADSTAVGTADFKPPTAAAGNAADAGTANETDNVDDLAKLAGLLDLGLEEDTAAPGLAAKLANLAMGDPEVPFAAKRDSATGLSPTLGGFEAVLGGNKQVPSALAGIWGTGLGVWDHAPKSTGAAGPSLFPAASSPFAAAAASGAPPEAAAAPGSVQLASPTLGPGIGGAQGGINAVSGPPSTSTAGINSPSVPAGGGVQPSNMLAQLLASAAAGAPGAVRPPAVSLPASHAAPLARPGITNQPMLQSGAMAQQTGMHQMGGVGRPQVPSGPASGGVAASNPLAVLFAGQAKQLQQQQQQQLEMPGVNANAARPGGVVNNVNLQAQQLLQQQQQQGQQQSNLASLMQQLQQQQAQQQALAAARGNINLQQAQQQQLQQQQAQQRAAAAAAFTQQQQQQQLLGAVRPQQPQANLQFLLQQQQQQAQLRQQQQQQQQQLLLAQQLAQNQAVQAANLASRSHAVGAGIQPGQFLQGAGGQLPAGFGGMAGAQRPGVQQGFGMAPQDQQAQLRQLLSQAQQRVPGMPGMS